MRPDENAHIPPNSTELQSLPNGSRRTPSNDSDSTVAMSDEHQQQHQLKDKPANGWDDIPVERKRGENVHHDNYHSHLRQERRSHHQDQMPEQPAGTMAATDSSDNAASGGDAPVVKTPAEHPRKDMPGYKWHATLAVIFLTSIANGQFCSLLVFRSCSTL